ncbi:MAG TPA: response regulator [Polyangia bacterium]|jgi:CheY-like chemotaxis protein|nr:response regulator [Polyangia bacterium]
MPEPVVLLVEDEDDAREVLATALEDAHYKVLRAANGAEALKVLADQTVRCDLILLDLMMPVMNGWDFRHRQRQDPRLARIPVVLMSAGARLASTAGGLDASGFITKPVEIDDLLNNVKRLCM